MLTNFEKRDGNKMFSGISKVFSVLSPWLLSLEKPLFYHRLLRLALLPFTLGNIGRPDSSYLKLRHGHET